MCNNRCSSGRLGFSGIDFEQQKTEKSQIWHRVKTAEDIYQNYRKNCRFNKQFEKKPINLSILIKKIICESFINSGLCEKQNFDGTRGQYIADFLEK